MSGGPLPPVPDLIPIAALLRSPRGRQQEERDDDQQEEQRRRRPGRHLRTSSIDSVAAQQSRGCPGGGGSSAAPRPPQSRKAARSDRHRRRREHRKSRARRCPTPPPAPPPPPSPPPPRVNPIFVWVRQEDTRIVDVKCEDYDKRNRILLTKTAQGWRAIPRTETLAPLRESSTEARHHHHRHRKARKSKVRRRSAAVQVDADAMEDDEDEEEAPPSPTWSTPVNVESLLPSHKIHVPQKCHSPATTAADNVNSGASECAQTQPENKCTKMCDVVVSPLDNLLAVAEFEFNQHMQSGEWHDHAPINDDDQKDFISNMEQLDTLIDSCSKSDDKNEAATKEECDYTEDDDNNLAMDDILSRLEQSLRSPECPEIAEVLNSCSSLTKTEDVQKAECFPSDINDNTYKSVPDEENEIETLFRNEEAKPEENKEADPKPSPEPQENVAAEPQSTTAEDEPTDLTVKPKYDNNECSSVPEEAEQPTDLSVPKSSSSPIRSSTPRPPSQNSEAIQSPQPSGIPAVPPSPDIVTTSANCKNKSVFLESLLTTASQKMPLNSEVTIVKQKEPLDLGKCRKSASPTVTCSEEVKNKSKEEEAEPPSKKFKPNDLTLKNLLDIEMTKSGEENKSAEKTNAAETPRLLELLKTDSGPDPLTQLRQVLCDTTLNVPDPMLVPKERLSQIISHPGREIPRLLKQRPELRLPEALAFPHLLQDPDILVITLQQLETIVLKQNQSLNLKDIKISNEKDQDKNRKREKTPEMNKENQLKKKSLDDSVNKLMAVARESQPKAGFNELANDIDAATTAAFNQMLWLPYLNQLEAMSFGNNPEVMKMLSNSLPMYPTNQLPDLNHLMGSSRFPPPINFPIQQPQLNYNNPLEMSMWQEAMMQANMLRPKHPFDGLNPKNSFRDYLDKMNFKPSASHKPNPISKPSAPNFYPPGSNPQFQNSFLNVPNTFQKQNLQLPQYNPLFNQKSQQKSHSYLPKQKFDSKPSFQGFYPQRDREEKHKQKVSCKSFANVGYHQKNGDYSKHHHAHQPIDLSGSTAPAAKLKVKQHLIDPANASKLLKHDDVPEVGSTTASVEEMQDAHKHLWHPLFGNQKGYHSPWNWTTVTATGE